MAGIHTRPTPQVLPQSFMIDKFEVKVTGPSKQHPYTTFTIHDEKGDVVRRQITMPSYEDCISRNPDCI